MTKKKSSAKKSKTALPPDMLALLATYASSQTFREVFNTVTFQTAERKRLAVKNHKLAPLFSTADEVVENLWALMLHVMQTQISPVFVLRPEIIGYECEPYASGERDADEGEFHVSMDLFYIGREDSDVPYIELDTEAGRSLYLCTATAKVMNITNMKFVDVCKQIAGYVLKQRFASEDVTEAMYKLVLAANDKRHSANILSFCETLQNHFTEDQEEGY